MEALECSHAHVSFTRMFFLALSIFALFVCPEDCRTLWRVGGSHVPECARLLFILHGVECRLHPSLLCLISEKCQYWYQIPFVLNFHQSVAYFAAAAFQNFRCHTIEPITISGPKQVLSHENTVQSAFLREFRAFCPLVAILCCYSDGGIKKSRNAQMPPQFLIPLPYQISLINFKGL